MAGKGKGKGKGKKSKNRSHAYQDASGSGQDPGAGVVVYDDNEYDGDDDGVPPYEGDDGGVPPDDNEEDTYTYPAPLLTHHVAGAFPLRDLEENEHLPFNIVAGGSSQFSTVGKYALSANKYTCTLPEYLKTKGDSMTHAYTSGPYKKQVARNWARSLVRGIIRAFYDVHDEEHTGLRILENYLVTVPTCMNTNRDLLKADDYDQDIRVQIVHNKIEDKKPRKTKTAKERCEAVMLVIFNDIFKKQNNAFEWIDFGDALKKGKLDYCVNHPCLWHWRDRLVFYVKLFSAITGQSKYHVELVFKAIRACRRDALYTKSWEDRLEPHPPLRDVLNYHSKDEGETEAINKFGRGDSSWELWVQGVLLIKFIRNCYGHLTQCSWKQTRFDERHYKIDPDNEQDPYYRELIFLDHLLTHFVYPKLLLELYGNLLVLGYSF